MLSALVTACQPELPSRTLVTGLRVLGIQVGAPEVQPGFQTRVKALVADPEGEGRALDWLLTLCTPDETTGGCKEYEDILAVYPNPDIAQTYFSQCCVRFGTGTPVNGVLELGGGPSSTVITDKHMLEGVDERTARAGINAQLTLVVCEHDVCSSGVPPSGASDSPGSITLNLPPDQSALAVKRIRVSTVPIEEENKNPDLLELEIDGQLCRSGGSVTLAAGQTHTLVPRLTDTSIQTYTYVKEDGTSEQRVESPYFSWYATAGDFEDYSSDAETSPEASNTWTPPALTERTDVVLYAVVWDRRGGLDWLSCTASLTE